MNEQSGHPSAKRAQIIQGAAMVFTQDGYEGASMSQIAAEAGVSKGTLYNYFDSKSALFAVFVEQKANVMLAGLFETTSEEDEPELALRSIARRMIEMLLSPEGMVLYRIVVSEARKFPHLATIFWEAGPSRLLDRMARWIACQQAAGRLEVEDPMFAAEQFMALCQARLVTQSRLQLLKHSSEADIEKVVDGAVRLFLSGFAVGELASVLPKG